MDGSVDIFQRAGRAPIQDGRDVADWINFIIAYLSARGLIPSIEHFHDEFEKEREKRTILQNVEVNVIQYNVS